MPPSLSVGLSCATAAVTAAASTAPRMPERTRLMEASCRTAALTRTLFPLLRSCRKRREAASCGHLPLRWNGTKCWCEQDAMGALATSTGSRLTRRARVAPAAIILLAAAAGPAIASPCAFEPQGEGHVAAVLDARSFRLEDGREVRLAGIEPVASEKQAASRTQALARILIGREVKLRGDDDTPDRYGRQPAFVFLAPAETLVQGELLAQGEALASATVADRACASFLMAAETTARQAKLGIWGDPAAIKNSESPG